MNQSRATGETGDGGGGGDIHIGSMSGGAVASGPQASAVHQAAAGPVPVPDPAVRELLAAVGTLREHLTLLEESQETAETDSALARVENDIAETGRPDPSRLAELTARLQSGATGAARLASAGAVTRAAAGLLR